MEKRGQRVLTNATKAQVLEALEWNRGCLWYIEVFDTRGGVSWGGDDFLYSFQLDEEEA